MVVRFFFNGEWIVLGDVLGIVRVWVRNEDCILRFEIWVLFGLVDDLDWLFDGQCIVVCGDGKGLMFVKVFLYENFCFYFGCFFFIFGYFSD